VGEDREQQSRHIEYLSKLCVPREAVVLVAQTSQAAEKPGFGVILSEAKNLSSI
jgi:hypothetical protein